MQPRIRIARVSGRHLAIERDGFVRAARALQRAGKIRLHVCRIRLERQRLLKKWNGFVELLLRIERHAQVIQRVGILRLQRHRFPVLGDRIIYLPGMEKRRSQAVVRLRQAGHHLQRLLIRRNRFWILFLVKEG